MNTTNNNPTVKMSKGFTMIELIFVIVIIGILAAVAIPKLAATRDDAKVATALSETGIVLREMTTYYTANGQFNNDKTEMSNIGSLTVATDGDVDTAKGKVFTYQTPKDNGELENCVTFTVKNKDGEVTIAKAATGETALGNVCTGVHAASTFTTNLAKTHKVGGSRVDFK